MHKIYNIPLYFKTFRNQALWLYCFYHALSRCGDEFRLYIYILSGSKLSRTRQSSIEPADVRFRSCAETN